MRGGYKGKHSQYNKNGSKSEHKDVTFVLLSKLQVGVQIPYELLKQNPRNIIKYQGQGQWNYQKKSWIIPRQKYQSTLNRLKEYFNSYNQKVVRVNQIQSFVLKAEEALFNQMQKIQFFNSNHKRLVINYNMVQTSIQPETVPFHKKLFQFQKQSLKFGIERHGRMLLADEMGVGKTIQSLALAYVYKHEWPLLIICPTSLKLNWRQQIQTWYPKKYNVQLINSGKTYIKNQAQILIVSYDLAWRIVQMLTDIKVVIADQAHYLKSQDSNRSKVLVPYLCQRKRVVLLTGTPAFARPRQIFNLIKIVRPDVFSVFKQFGNRYCDPLFNQWSGKYQYTGCKNTLELHYLLKNTVMIRRLKQEVLKQLPDKNRQKIIVQTDQKIVKQIRGILQQNNVQEIQTYFQQMACKRSQFQEGEADTRRDVMQAYIKSGQAKMKATKQYINQILENNVKILVFAHHQKMLNELQEQMKKEKRSFIRIDGNVSLQQRHENVQKFQKDSNILVALLSITAAGVGLTLTAASTVIFAQLHWTPALMIQAEDRAHRVGQKCSVNCHYLIGQNTLDEILYKYLQRKVQKVSSFIDGKAKDFESQVLQKGEKGKISKRQQAPLQSRFNFESIMPIIGNNQSSISNQYSQMTDVSSQDSDLKDKSIGSYQDKISRKKQPTLNDYFEPKSKPKIMMSVLKEQVYQQSEDFRETQFKQRPQNDFQYKCQQKNILKKEQLTKNEQDEEFSDQFFDQLVKAIKSKDGSSRDKKSQSNCSSNTDTQTLSCKTTQTL